MDKKRRTFVFSLLTTGALVGSTGLLSGFLTKQAFAAGEKNNLLIVFYSWSGNTRNLASQIQQKTGGDRIELALVTPYPTHYNDCVAQARKDKANNARPPLATTITNINQYDVILLGYPNWISTIPMPIATFLESYDFSGKTIVPFCSHGGGGLAGSVQDIRKLAPQAKLLEGLAVRGNGGSSASTEIDRWLRKNNLVTS